MKSVGLFGSKKLQFVYREQNLELDAPDQAIVKVLACGVCGTDLHLAKHMEEPTPLGHEIAAEVVEVGPMVKHCMVGDLVIVEDCTMCGVCEQCKRGNPYLCTNMITIEGQPGMSTHMKVSGRSLVPFHDLDPIVASLTEPLTVCLNTVTNAKIPIGASVAIIGCGPLGLMSALVARHLGAGEIIMTGRSTTERGKARLDAASHIDVDMVIDVAKEDPLESIASIYPKGVDRVIVTAPPQSIPQAVRMAAYGATVSFFGIDLGGAQKIELDINDLVFRKITLQPFLGEPALHFPDSIRLLKKGLVPADLLITHTTTLEDAPKLFSKLVDGTSPIIKAVILPLEKSATYAHSWPKQNL
jgi:L-iditol 2-dehydrogenase